jgi:dipeptidyl aminopeptidase/acylaminoacyl peptidase
MAKRLILSLLIILLAAGCQSAPAPTAERATATVPSAAIPTVITLPTPTIESTPTKPALLNELIRKCIEVSPSHSWTTALPGTLILSKPMTENYLIDMSTGKKTMFNPNNDLAIGDFEVSPNNNWFSYLQGISPSSDILVLESADRKERTTYPKDSHEWQVIAYWLNDDTLVLWDAINANPITHITLFNPFTGEKQVMGTDYPDILPYYYDWVKLGWPSITIFSPSLEKLIYLKISPTGLHPGNVTLVLWDRKENRSIKEINDFGFASVYPLWKMDSSGLFYVKTEVGFPPRENKDEIFYLSSSGENPQLTRLSDYFQDGRIYSYSMSPGQNLLAFVLVSKLVQGQERGSRLLLLNLSSLQIFDYCLPTSQTSPLIWSPDGRYIAYSEDTTGEDSRTIILDLIKEEAFVVDPNLWPSGWLATEK